MRSKIERELARGIYVPEGAPNALWPAYRNTARGWLNYLISDTITFSHRHNDYTRYDYPNALEAHEYYELIIYHSGADLQYIADGQYFIVPARSALLIKPNTMHMLRLPAPISCERYVINFKDPTRLFPEPAALDFLAQGSENCALFKADQHDFSSLSAAVEAELQAETSPFRNARALMRLTELFLALAESQTAEAVDREALSSISSVPNFILEVKEYIDREYLRIGSIAELAEQFHYNREYLSRSFSRYFHMSVYSYILRRRLMHCSAMLSAGESVAHAAAMAGFANRASFNKLFLKQFGCTPSAYREKR